MAFDEDQQEQLWRSMKHHAAELSLGPSLSAYSSSSSESDGSFCRKRNKCCPWEGPFNIQTCIDLQQKDPLPPEWEQCLDLQSGRMYYLNRRTLRKSWEWPIEQTVDLELNIFTPNSGRERTGLSEPQVDMSLKSSTSNIMVAVPCHRCHLLVMLCTSSPVCPNCKFVHTLPPGSQAAPPQSLLPCSKIAGMRTLQTLNLLN